MNRRGFLGALAGATALLRRAKAAPALRAIQTNGASTREHWMACARARFAHAEAMERETRREALKALEFAAGDRWPAH